MKRNPYDVTIKKIYPLLFWADCAKCKMQFRREHMFKIEVNTPFNQAFPVNVEAKYCAACAPDKDTALGLFKEQFKAGLLGNR